MSIAITPSLVSLRKCWLRNKKIKTKFRLVHWISLYFYNGKWELLGREDGELAYLSASRKVSILFHQLACLCPIEISFRQTNTQLVQFARKNRFYRQIVGKLCIGESFLIILSLLCRDTQNFGNNKKNAEILRNYAQKSFFSSCELHLRHIEPIYLHHPGISCITLPPSSLPLACLQNMMFSPIKRGWTSFIMGFL